MPIVSKPVDVDFGSAARSQHQKGWTVDFTDAEWAQLKLDYRLGLTVSPDPAVETAVKLGSHDQGIRDHAQGWQWFPNGTNGIYASTAGPQWQQQWAPLGGYVVQLDYDPADVIEHHPTITAVYQEIQLSTAVVVGIWTRVPARVGETTVVELDVATGAASGTVSYAASDPDDTPVQSGTASHGSGGQYSFTLAAQPGPVTLTVAWSGTFAGAARTFTTRIAVRYP